MYLVLENFSNNPENEGFLSQVYFEKAFDSVEHISLFQILAKLGFGNYLINQVKPWLLNSSKFHQKVRRKRSEKKVRVLFLKSTSSTIKRPTSKLKIIVVKFVKNS